MDHCKPDEAVALIAFSALDVESFLERISTASGVCWQLFRYRMCYFQVLLLKSEKKGQKQKTQPCLLSCGKGNSAYILSSLGLCQLYYCYNMSQKDFGDFNIP